MDKINQNKGTPTKGSSTRNDISSYENSHREYGDGDSYDINQPSSSNATPEIPIEMPAREGK